jgi:DNA mismatch repair protein MutS
MERLTPLLQQYKKIKDQYPDAILLFRMGDFYETLFADAQTASKVLGITLTSKPIGKDHRVPLAGIPHKSLETYLSRLVNAGFKVAVCEQLEDPRLAKTIVRRDVVEVVTPGTILRPTLLEQTKNNYLVGIMPAGNRYGLAFADITTGEFSLTELAGDLIIEELARLEPKELIYPKDFDGLTAILKSPLPTTARDDYAFGYDFAYERLLRHFQVANLDGFGCEGKVLGIQAAGAVLEYLSESQKNSLPQIRKLSYYTRSNYLYLDGFTRRNLELTERLRDGSREGSLYSVMDKTRTPPGARLLRSWLLSPLLDITEIRNRQDAIAELTSSSYLVRQVTDVLKEIGDLERLNTRIACERAHGRELQALKNWLTLAPKIKQALEPTRSPLLAATHSSIGDFTAVTELIDRTLVDSPPLTITEGGMIKPGVNKELDELRDLAKNGKDWIARLQESERKKTGISNLRVNYNSVFGYYIEVTKSYLTLVPKDYLRKQTLVNCERFITPELKEYESKILNAEDRIQSLEYELFIDLRKTIAQESARIQELARMLAQLDVLSGLAKVALENSYHQPEVTSGEEIVIRNGRHPVVEKLTTIPFVPNDIELDSVENQILLITGPNMAGKSTYLRQAALITIMAQMGSFVPAAEAHIGVVDKIFTRIGASDDLSRGVSTFLAEMMETANILNNATPRSLVILDEIGRGTATYDGLAIAWAVVEYLHQTHNLKPKTLFATHYHELTDLAQFLPGIKNYNFLVKEHEDEIIFLRKLVPGRSDRSYGIAVAKLAGLPVEVIERAKEVLADFEKGEELSVKSLSPDKTFQLSLFYPMAHPVLDELKKLDLEHLSPLEALNKLAELKKKLEEK